MLPPISFSPFISHCGSARPLHYAPSSVLHHTQASLTDAAGTQAQAASIAAMHSSRLRPRPARKQMLALHTSATPKCIVERALICMGSHAQARGNIICTIIARAFGERRDLRKKGASRQERTEIWRKQKQQRAKEREEGVHAPAIVRYDSAQAVHGIAIFFEKPPRSQCPPPGLYPPPRKQMPTTNIQRRQEPKCEQKIDIIRAAPSLLNDLAA